LDVVAGVVIGFLEAIIIGIIWLGPEASNDFVKWISDERSAGSDADIL
jgi:hypothetical protein